MKKIENKCEFLLDHLTGVIAIISIIASGFLIIYASMSRQNDIDNKVVRVSKEENGNISIYNPAFEYESFETEYDEDSNTCKVIVVYIPKEKT